METLTKAELKSLTLDKLNTMTEEQLNQVAHMVIQELNEYEIEDLPKDVRQKLQIKREHYWTSKQTWIALILSALAMTIVQAMLGE